MFNSLYKGKKSKFFRDIHRKVFGDDYPEEADSESFITLTDLQNFIKYLNIGPGKTFIDLGCGRGGPGMWIARETGANYVGIDISEVAVELATHRIKDFGLKGNVSFLVGDLFTADLTEIQYDAAISIDVLMFIPDLLTNIHETARILRSGANFIFTTWEQNFGNRINDYRPLLQKAGFKIEVYDEIPDWESRQRKVYQHILDSKDMLIKEMGKAEASQWIKEAQTTLPLLKNMTRVFVVAKKI